MLPSTQKRESLKRELDQLINKGEFLYIAMLQETDKLPEKLKQQIRENKNKLPVFAIDYQNWYSIAQQLVKQVLPDREADFIRQYHDPKRKHITYATYTVADYVIGLRTGLVEHDAAIPKFQTQLSILKAASAALESRLVDITQVLQSDLFDSELEAAKELCKKKHARAAGAVAGVVLEGHLAHACSTHGCSPAKKNPTINDFNQALKDKGTIDTPMWRFVQHLADIRNQCDHAKGAAPTETQVFDMIEGVAKVTKTVF